MGCRADFLGAGKRRSRVIAYVKAWASALSVDLPEWEFNYFARNMRLPRVGERMVLGLPPRFVPEDGEELPGTLRHSAQIVDDPAVGVI